MSAIDAFFVGLGWVMVGVGVAGALWSCRSFFGRRRRKVEPKPPINPVFTHASAAALEFDLYAEGIAVAFHATYEELAPGFDYATRKGSARPWNDVPEQNRQLMTATVRALLTTGAIRPPTRGEVRFLVHGECECGWSMAAPEGEQWPKCPRCGEQVMPPGGQPGDPDNPRRGYVADLLPEQEAMRLAREYRRANAG